MGRLDEIRKSASAKRQQDREPDFIGGVSVAKCRGRVRITTLKTADRMAESSSTKPYFCCLCHGYHVERPVEEVTVYCTTYCNMGHRLDNGKPVAHECYVLPPRALALEREGKYEEAIEVLEANKPLRRHRGLKETTNE